jgi:hypothetical protein
MYFSSPERRSIRFSLRARPFSGMGRYCISMSYTTQPCSARGYMKPRPRFSRRSAKTIRRDGAPRAFPEPRARTNHPL